MVSNWESQTRRSVNGVLTDNAKQVVDTITDARDRDTCSVLAVLDNGIGLDATTMDALLSDGTSAKRDAASGSYGNGHMVAIPARPTCATCCTAASSRVAPGSAPGTRCWRPTPRQGTCITATL